MAEPLILTNVGLAKLASATPEDQLHIANVAVGDGNGGYPPLYPSMTALVNEVWRGTSSAPIRDQDNDAVLIFETIIPAADGGFFIREIGLFDSDGELIAIGQTGVVEKPTGTSGTPLTMTVRVRLALANAAQTNLIINDAPYIDHQALTNRDANDAHPISSITGLRGELDAKPDSSDLGTAAYEDVGTGSGNVMQVGAFGLGSASLSTINPIGNIDDATKPTGFYGAPAGTAGNLPLPGVVIVQYKGGAGAVTSQMLIADPEMGGGIHVRAYDADMGWRPWQIVYTNISAPIASEGESGIIEIATTAEAQALTNDTKALTPNKLSVALQPHISGSATFTRSSNQIVLTGIVPTLALEVGDVIEITGSADNNRLHTVESITDDDTLIVNYEHRNGAGSLSLVDETANVTIKRLAKWYAAPIGLGQGWVDVTSIRTNEANFTNTTGRPIMVSANSPTNSAVWLTVSGLEIGRATYSTTAGGGGTTQLAGIIPAGATYVIAGGANYTVRELR